MQKEKNLEQEINFIVISQKERKKKGKKELGFFFFLKLKRKELYCHFTFTISLRCLESKGDAVVYFKILGDWF